MSATKQMVSPEVIESFLSGHNPMKYVVGIEGGYHEPSVHLVISDPETGKRVEKHNFQPFIWFKDDVSKIMYGGKKTKIIEANQKYKVTIKRLVTQNAEGFSPERIQKGYKFIAHCKGSYNDLINYFKAGGIDVFSKEYSRMFFAFSPIEQFMIQTGIRLFKGMDDYNDLHRFQFDLETEGLDARRHAIFQIGMRDNRGIEHVLETIGDTPQQRRDCERENIIKFFCVIDYLKPDTITGYNSDQFDWPFFITRCERLGIDLSQVVIGLLGRPSFKRKPATLKLGNETEAFEQTYIFGHNIIDIAHAVRRAQAINSDIKKWNLKYITQYSGVAKKNRVYVPGNMIHTIWSDKSNQYAFDESNGDWYKITDRMPIKEGYTEVAGNFIIQRYLLDDLWETEQIDLIFNQAAFLIAKLLPTNFSRSTTMGTASQWKLIMAAWSYENNLAIPAHEEKRDFTGGLSRLLRVGYSENVEKEDFAALYPKCQLTHDIFPDLDISGVMKGLLTYVVDTRDKFKFLKEDEEAIIDEIDKKLKELKASGASKEEIAELETKRKEHKFLKDLYDKKQLPLKILANSWFGAYGAPHIFNWGDINSAEETTCRGRQYLRLMVRFFKEKYGFEPLVLDTDGVNFAVPKGLETHTYLCKGSHWKTTKNAGKLLNGAAAVLAEFNETFMMGRMGLDTDAVYTSTINFARKNYANNKKGKIKLVGNSIKSKKMSVYIEDFINKSIKILLEGKGKEFIDMYYEYVDKIYNFQIPLVKIASKSKIKSTVSEYKKRVRGKNKKGKPMPRQAHMELVMKEDLNVNLGDVIYYVNNGKAKSHGDLKTTYSEDGSVDIQFNCRLIQPSVVENDLELISEIESLKKMLDKAEDADKVKALETEIANKEAMLSTEEYNVAKYLDSFNKKVKPLLVCFLPEVRDNVLLKIVKEKKTKIEKLQERSYFTEAQCKLVSGMPYKEGDQDDYVLDLMTMEDKEIKFWDRVNKVPNNMEESEWEIIRADYHVRKAKEREDGIQNEKEHLNELFKKQEVEDLKKIERTATLPLEMISIATVDDEGWFVSRKWNVQLCSIEDIFKYENEAIERDAWYTETQVTGDKKKSKYQKWVDYKLEQEFMTNQPVEQVSGMTEVLAKTIVDSIDLVQENIEKMEEKIYMKIATETEEEDDEEDEEESDEEVQVDDFLPEFLQIDLVVELNDVKGDGPIPVVQVAPVQVETPKPEPPKQTKQMSLNLNEDGWNF